MTRVRVTVLCVVVGLVLATGSLPAAEAAAKPTRVTIKTSSKATVGRVILIRGGVRPLAKGTVSLQQRSGTHAPYKWKTLRQRGMNRHSDYQFEMTFPTPGVRTVRVAFGNPKKKPIATSESIRITVRNP